MRIALEKGFNPPDAGKNILVELESGIITGGRLVPVYNTPLYDSASFRPIGVPCHCFLESVVAWHTDIILSGNVND